VAESQPAIRLEIRADVAHVRLDRPAVCNAFDDATAAQLLALFRDLGERQDLRAVVLGGAGSIFCAGGDLNWMRRVADYGREENLADAAAFQEAFEAIDCCPLPVIGRIHGAALGGGAGLVAVCDIAIAAAGTRLGFPEVRLGLVPGVISPYVLRKIGLSHARHYFLTGARFDASEALRIGLVQGVVPEDELDAAVESVLRDLRQCAPQGIAGVKQLLRGLADVDEATARRRAQEAITAARASEDGREGISAFLARRRPGWIA